MKIFTLHTLFFFLFLNLVLSNHSYAQTASTTITYSGFQACGGCAVCGADYYCYNTVSSYCGNTVACNTKTFVDPCPAGSIVTSVLINYFSADCAGGSLSATINGNAVPTVNEGNTGCSCSSAPCAQSASSSSNFPCGLPGYINGGTNSLQLCTGNSVCINRLVIVLTYAPANQATPAIQPTSVMGQVSICPGVPQAYSCPVVVNAASYNWTVPAGWVINSGQGTANINATPGSSGNVCVSAQNTCGNSPFTCLPVNVYANSTAPTSASANPNPACAGASSTTLSLSGGSLGTAASWNWYSGSCGGTFEGTGPSITVSPSSTTTYFVNAVGTCNTTSCASVVFTVNPIPIANAGSSSVLNCTATSATLAGSGGGSYTWTGPGITSGANTANPTVNLPGTYSLIVTSLGCTSLQSTVSVTQNTITPTITLSSNSLTITCSNPTASVSVSTTASPVSYSWSPVSGIVAGTQTTSTPFFNSAGSYSVEVTNTTNGCTTNISSNVVTVVSNSSLPTMTLTTAGANNGTLTCSSNSIVITPTVMPSGGTYTWTSGAGVVANTQNITITTPGIYTLTVTDGVSGCSSSNTNPANTYTVYADNTPPTATITATSTNTIIGCGAGNSTVTLSGVASSTNTTYNWLPGSVAGQTLTVNSANTYSLVTTNNDNGCSNTTLYTVNGSTTAPQGVNAGTATSIACGNSTVTLNGVSTNTNVSYSWSGPAATSINSGSNTANPIVTDLGTYTLTVTDNLTNCQSTATINVTQGTIAAAFTATPTTGFSPLTVNFTDASIGATGYSWNFGNLNSSTLQNPSAIFVSGTYTVILTISAGTCNDTASIVITVEDVLSLEIPNVFTPNNDGTNDVFTVISKGVKEISLQIFNRWGEKLYELVGPKTAWDGLNSHGVKVPDGTYFYFVKAIGFDDKVIQKNGTVNLFR